MAEQDWGLRITRKVLSSHHTARPHIHTHTHVCMYHTLVHHTLHTESVKDITLTLHETISHAHTHTQRRCRERQLVVAFAVAANVLNSVCLACQAHRSSAHILPSWELHVCMCQCVRGPMFMYMSCTAYVNIFPFYVQCEFKRCMRKRVKFSLGPTWRVWQSDFPEEKMARFQEWNTENKGWRTQVHKSRKCESRKRKKVCHAKVWAMGDGCE